MIFQEDKQKIAISKIRKREIRAATNKLMSNEKQIKLA